MTLVNIDLRNQGYETSPDDRVVFYSLLVREGEFGTISTAPVEVPLVDGKGSRDLAPGPVGVQIIAGQVADTRVREGRVPAEGPTTLNVVLTLLPEYSDAVRQHFLASIRAEQDKALSRIDAEVASAVDAEMGQVTATSQEALARAKAAEGVASGSNAKAVTATSVASTAFATASNAVSRVAALEGREGLGPESPVDGQTATLILQSDTLTRSAVDAATDQRSISPITPLEYSGVATPWAEEERFWALMERSPRVRIDTVGESVGGRNIRLVSIGYPTAPPAPESIDANSLLLVGFQHGGEPISREVLMGVARDLASTDDPIMQDYLRTHPVHILPTVNPDSVDTWSYENADGININRDHLALLTPEGRAVRTAINKIRPHLIVDLHERSAPGEDFSVSSGRYIGTHPAISQVDDGIYTAVIKAVSAAGTVTTEFQGSTQEPRTLRIAGELSSCPVVTFESNKEGRSMRQRAIASTVAVRAVMEYHRTHSDHVRAAVIALRHTAPAMAYLKSSAILDPAPTGYRLTSAQWAQVADVFALHELQATPDGGGYVVTLSQPGGWMVPNLLDPQALHPIGQGSRIFTDIPDYITPTARPVYGALPRHYTKVFGEDPVGAEPSGMTRILPGVFTVQEVEGATDGRALAVINLGDPGGYVLDATLDDQLADDSEILVRWRTASGGSHGLNIWTRMAHSPTPTGYRNAYMNDPAPDTGALLVGKYSDGAFTRLSRPLIPRLAGSTWYLTRVRAHGPHLTMKTWRDGTPEPVLWDSSLIDNSYPHGWAGIGQIGLGAPIYIDWMTQATGGAPATGPASATPAVPAPPGPGSTPEPDPDPEPGPSATYTKIFGEDDIGAQPSGMTALLPTTATIAQVDGATHGKALHLLSGDPVAYAITAAMDDPGLAHSELLIRWRTGGQPGHGPTAWHRLAPTTEDYRSYRLTYSHASTVGHARIATREDGDFEFLKNQDIPILAVDTWHLMRARISGSQLMLKIWQDGAPEPATWTVTTTDSRFPGGQSAVGQLGIGMPISIDWVVHATGGATAVPPTIQAE